MPHFPASDGRVPWRATVLTLFPEMFPGPLGLSLAGQALHCVSGRSTRSRFARLRAWDVTAPSTMRLLAAAAGMVMRADVLGAAIDHARTLTPGLPLLYLTPRGERLTAVSRP